MNAGPSSLPAVVAEEKKVDTIFGPKSVAVIGTPTKERSTGNRLVNHAIDFGFKGFVDPGYRKANEMLGVTNQMILYAPGEVIVEAVKDVMFKIRLVTEVETREMVCSNQDT